jgi:membrane protein DedA with SNARE-associated domain
MQSMPREPFSLKLITFLSGFDGITAYGAILGVLLICGLGVPIPEDITLVAAGILAAIGNISLPGAIIAGFVGVLIGDSFLFFLGRIYGHKVFTLPVFRTFFTEARLSLAREKILNNSKFICFMARFLPGLRAPIFLTAGIMGVKPSTFILLDGLAALISVPFWVVVGYFLGDNLDTTLGFVIKAQKSVIVVVVLLVLGFILYRRFKRNKSLAAPAKTEL